jgi:hypothetical protein
MCEKRGREWERGGTGMFVLELTHGGDHGWEDLFVEDGEVEVRYIEGGKLGLWSCGGLLEYFLHEGDDGGTDADGACTGVYEGNSFGCHFGGLLRSY